MSLLTKIDQDFTQALKEKAAQRLSVLRMLKTAFQNAVIDKRVKANDLKASLTEEEAVAVVKRQVKQLEEALQMFKTGGRPELAAQNEAEVSILKAYLPAQASEDEVRKVVQGVVAKMGTVGPQDFGKVMGAAMKELKGQADGTVVSKAVKEMLG